MSRLPDDEEGVMRSGRSSPSRRARTRRWLTVGGVVLAAILAGGVFALLVSGRDDPRPLAVEASPTPTATVQTPSPTAAPLASAAPATTHAQTPEPTATSTPTSDGGAWVGPERIATRDYGELSLVVDDDGIAHAAAELDHAIYYLTNATGSWTREPLSSPLAGGSDGRPSIALDRDGSVAVAFIRYRGWEEGIWASPVDPEGVFVLSNASGRWSEPSLVPVELGHDSRSVSLKAMGSVLHLVYVSAATNVSSVWYATNRGGTWTSEQVAARGWWPSLELASDGTARIAFESDDGLHLAAATSPDGSFNVERLTGVDGGWSLQLALDDGDQPHIAYWDERGGSLYTRLRDGSLSASEATFPEADALAHPCDDARGIAVGAMGMAIDDRGSVHLISENDLVFAGLWYSSNRSGRFESVHLRPPDPWDRDYCSGADLFPLRPAALAVDRLGRPHILFMAYEDGPIDGARELWYAIGPGD